MGVFGFFGFLQIWRSVAGPVLSFGCGRVSGCLVPAGRGRLGRTSFGIGLSQEVGVLLLSSGKVILCSRSVCHFSL